MGRGGGQRPNGAGLGERGGREASTAAQGAGLSKDGLLATGPEAGRLRGNPGRGGSSGVDQTVVQGAKGPEGGWSSKEPCRSCLDSP